MNADRNTFVPSQRYVQKYDTDIDLYFNSFIGELHIYAVCGDRVNKKVIKIKQGHKRGALIRKISVLTGGNTERTLSLHVRTQQAGTTCPIRECAETMAVDFLVTNMRENTLLIFELRNLQYLVTLAQSN